MKTALIIVFSIAILVPVFFLARSIMKPIRLNQEKDVGEAVKKGLIRKDTSYIVFLSDPDRQLVVGCNEQRTKTTGFPGMKAGNVRIPNNNAGNRED